MPFYFDESVHNRGGFILGAWVHGPDPTANVKDALVRVGLDPDIDEFKSSARMDRHPEQAALRRELRQVLREGYRFGVVITPDDQRERLGIEALRGLTAMSVANGLSGRRTAAFLDEGIFPSSRSAVDSIAESQADRYCDILVEQDSCAIRGLQLADLVAHTSSSMLLDTLGLLSKTVKAGCNSGYPPETDISLGFELWASLRYNFFNGGLPPGVSSNEEMLVEVAPYGLYIADTCSAALRTAAVARFGRQYLGCIH